MIIMFSVAYLLYCRMFNVKSTVTVQIVVVGGLY